MAQAPLLCAAFAKGAGLICSKQQAAGLDRPGNTGHDSTRVSRFAQGGDRKLHPRPSQPAKRGVIQYFERPAGSGRVASPQ